MGARNHGKSGRIRNSTPALVLFLIAPLVGEVLPGARSILSMLNPLTFIVLTTLYGSGAIIIRETVLRWKKGWPSIFLLGLAYGVAEEGIGAQSFANPSWLGLSVPVTYGRLFGVNWVWIVQILLYHALISISLSILIASFLFPNKRGESYVTSKTLYACIAIITLNLFFEVFVLFPYNAGVAYYILSILSIVMFSLLAKRAPVNFNVRRILIFPGWAIFLVAFLFTLSYFAVLESLLPHLVPPLLDFAATMIAAILMFTFLTKVRTIGVIEMPFFAAAGVVVYFSLTSVLFNFVDLASAVLFVLIMVAGFLRLKKANNSANFTAPGT